MLRERGCGWQVDPTVDGIARGLREATSLELGEEPATLQDYSPDLDQAADAEEAVSRLLGRMPAHLSDDVTVLVLRRLAEVPAGVF